MLIRKALFMHNKVSGWASLIRLSDGCESKPLSIWAGNPEGACLFVFEHYFWVNTARVNVSSKRKPPLISLQEHLHLHNSSINVTRRENSNTLTSAVLTAAGRNCKCVKKKQGGKIIAMIIKLFSLEERRAQMYVLWDCNKINHNTVFNVYRVTSERSAVYFLCTKL